MSDAMQFLLGLADLMEKFGVDDVEATEEMRGYDIAMAGIEFNIPMRCDDAVEHHPEKRIYREVEMPLTGRKRIIRAHPKTGFENVTVVPVKEKS